MNYHTPKSKKPLNLLVDEKLLARAREDKINISKVLDKALRQELATKWIADNANAFEANRKRIEEEGLWSDEFRPW